MNDIKNYEAMAKPLGTRASRPHVLEKCGQDARVPGKTGGFAISSYEGMAKLDLSEAERGWVSGRAGMLIDSFNKLADIDVSGVEPLITVLDVKNVFREDVDVKMLPREELLANAPEQYGGYFKVPKTIE